MTELEKWIEHFIRNASKEQLENIKEVLDESDELYSVLEHMLTYADGA